MSRAEGTVSAAPTKDFFVRMLTRDIDLADAILDLLDNCIDGAIRSTKELAEEPNRYSTYWAKLDFKDGKFIIADNCGGISPEAADHAFMMGRPDLERDNDITTVGMYGIGMKRALFKMGNSSSVVSKTDTASFRVTISPAWLADALNWDLPYELINSPHDYNGTVIEVSDINPGVSKEFFGENSVTFLDNLEKAISTHYSLIAHKGFKFYLNDKLINPVPLTVLFDETKGGIAPYLYEGNFEHVSVSLVVGFLGQAPNEVEVDENLEQPRRSSEDAGWTIICNDRVVLYKDKTKVTGWGVASVPSYHTQFITISGVVEFKSNQAEFLPVTTTKRGIDTSSDLYLRIKDFMVEGMKLFTNHTNVWKKFKEEEKTIFTAAKSYNVRDIPKMVPAESWTNVRGSATERRYLPKLPTPVKIEEFKQIRFTKPIKDIKLVANYLFEDSDTESSMVGAECFELILKDAMENL